MSDTDSKILVEQILHEDEEKGKQIRFVVSEFRGVAYLHLREYYLSYDEGYVPSQIGINIPTSIPSVQKLLSALAKTMADSEYRTLLEQALNEIKTSI